PSQFLEEVRDACAAGAGTVEHWEPRPDPFDEDPDGEEEESAVWPPEDDLPGAGTAVPEEGPRTRREEILEGATMVERARARMRAGEEDPDHRPAPPAGLRNRLRGWERDTELLLAHRHKEETGARTGPVQVELPDHLSVSSMVWLA